MKINDSIPDEYKKKSERPKPIKHGRDGHRMNKYERALLESKAQQQVFERFGSTFQPLEHIYKPAINKQRIKARTNKLIDPLVNRFEELDSELYGYLSNWLNTGEYKRTSLCITEITDWSNPAVASRIKRILNKEFNSLPGRISINEHDETIVLEWWEGNDSNLHFLGKR